MEVTLICLMIGTPKTMNFPFVSNEKLMVFGVPITKYIKVGIFQVHGYTFHRNQVSFLLLHLFTTERIPQRTNLSFQRGPHFERQMVIHIKVLKREHIAYEMTH